MTGVMTRLEIIKWQHNTLYPLKIHYPIAVELQLTITNTLCLVVDTIEGQSVHSQCLIDIDLKELCHGI